MIVEAIWNGVSAIPVWPEAMKEMLRCFPSWVELPFYDPWDTSSRIDNYLTATDRDMVIRMLKEDSGRSASAEYYRSQGWEGRAFDEWQKVFRHTFPSQSY
jgi:hypothetical protein